MAFYDKFERKHGRLPTEAEVQKEAKDRADGVKIIGAICVIGTALTAAFDATSTEISAADLGEPTPVVVHQDDVKAVPVLKV